MSSRNAAGPSGNSSWLSAYAVVDLVQVMPRRGFVFTEGHMTFQPKERWAPIVAAIQAEMPNFREREVDSALAAIMDMADDLRRQLGHRANPSAAAQTSIFDNARKCFDWAAGIPNGLTHQFFLRLIRAREIYVQLTHVRGLPKSDRGKEQGRLAQVIDSWTGARPVIDADEVFSRMPKSMVAAIAHQVESGEGDFDSIMDQYYRTGRIN